MSGFAIVSSAAREFEQDARIRAFRGQNVDMTLMFLAIDEARAMGDHIALTVLRKRIQDNLDMLAPGNFKAFLTKVLADVKTAEMDVVANRPFKKNDRSFIELQIAKAKAAMAEKVEAQEQQDAAKLKEEPSLA